MDVDRFKQIPLMGILRGGDATIAEPLVETLAAAGLETLEVAMNTPGAAAILRHIGRAAGSRLMIGAGTVTTPERLDAALEAGATFVVMPTLVGSLVARCREAAIPVFPGALTPSEIHAAWTAGATMVKVFPAKVFGPDYLREVKGPFEDIELLACGGVGPDNLARYFECGASAVAFGGSIFTPGRLQARDFDAIGEGVASLVAAYRRLR